MKKIKLALAMTALAFSTNAAAMPEQVPDKWYGNMAFMVSVVTGNPGFCRARPQVWTCF